ncbi:hypothetical protein EJB05_27955, partial [Eragrostis curvula]
MYPSTWYECFGDWMIMLYVTNSFVGCCLWSHMMEGYVNLFSIGYLDDWLPRQLGTLGLMKSRLRRWIKTKDMLEPSRCWLGVDIIGCNVRLSEARVVEEKLKEPRRVKMKSRIEEMIKMDFRQKSPYDTVAIGIAELKTGNLCWSHRMMRDDSHRMIRRSLYGFQGVGSFCRFREKKPPYDTMVVSV